MNRASAAGQPGRRVAPLLRPCHAGAATAAPSGLLCLMRDARARRNPTGGPRNG